MGRHRRVDLRTFCTAFACKLAARIPEEIKIVFGWHIDHCNIRPRCDLRHTRVQERFLVEVRQMKFAASSVFPDPTYTACFGYAQSGRVRSTLPVLSLRVASSDSGA